MPTSGTALTDAGGVARVGLPAGTTAGAFTVTVSATVAGVAVKSSFDYAVSFPKLTLGPLVITPATLSAGGNASVSVTVLSGGLPYTPPLKVSFSSPCITDPGGRSKLTTASLPEKICTSCPETYRLCGLGRGCQLRGHDGQGGRQRQGNHPADIGVVLVACDPALLQRPSIKEAAEPVALRPGLKVWTDDHNDLISALK